jgi:hypothetical protein
MEKKRRTRYLIAVYSIVASLAVILVLIGINYLKEPFQALAINLATNLLGVVLLFFLVDRLFALEEWGLAERVENAVNQLEQQTRFLQKETKSLKEWIINSTDISILGYSLVAVLRSDFVSFVERINAGAKLRLLIVDPKSNAGQVILEHSRVKDFPNDVFASLQHAKRIHEQIGPKDKGSIEVRLTTWLPSYGITIMDGKNEKGVLKVVVYPPYSSSSFGDRIQFIIKRRDDPHWFKVFVNQFESMWSRAHQVNLSQVGYEIT